jgi:hypothetical protein
MSTKELSRLEVMERLKEERMTQKAAALGIGERQVKRLWKHYRKKGVAGDCRFIPTCVGTVCYNLLMALL